MVSNQYRYILSIARMRYAQSLQFQKQKSHNRAVQTIFLCLRTRRRLLSIKTDDVMKAKRRFLSYTKDADATTKDTILQQQYQEYLYYNSKNEPIKEQECMDDILAILKETDENQCNAELIKTIFNHYLTFISLETQVSDQGRQSMGLENKDDDDKMKHLLMIAQHILPNDPLTFTIQCELAECLYRKKQYAESLKQYQACLKSCQTILGSEHVDTVTTMGKTAQVLFKLITKKNKNEKEEKSQQEIEEIEKAIQMFQQCCSIKEKVLGMAHTDTLSMKFTFIKCLLKLWKKESDQQALDMARLCFETSEKTYGKDDECTIRHQGLLAVCYDVNGKYDDALRINQDCLQRSRRIFGSEARHTLEVQHNLSFNLFDTKHGKEAIKSEEQCLEITRRVFPNDDKRISYMLHDLGIYLEKDGQDEKAISVTEESLELQKKTNSISFVTVNQLSTFLRKNKQLARALALVQEYLPICKETLGEEHVETLKLQYLMAHVLSDMGRKEESITIAKECLKLRQKVLGFDDSGTMRIQLLLGCMYCRSNQWKNAIEVLEPYVKMVDDSKNPNSKNQDTIVSMCDLAYAYDGNGEIEKAISVGEESVKKAVQWLGMKHRYTHIAHRNLSDYYAQTKTAENLGKAVGLVEACLVHPLGYWEEQDLKQELQEYQGKLAIEKERDLWVCNVCKKRGRAEDEEEEKEDRMGLATKIQKV